MTGEDRWWARVRRRPVPLDVAAASVLLVGELFVAPRMTGDGVPSALEAVLIVATLAVMPLRSRRPMLTLGLATVGAAAVLMTRGVETLATVAPLLALYSVVLRSSRRSTVLAWASTTVLLVVAVALGTPREFLLQESLEVVPWTAAVAALSDGLRNRRAYLAAVEERAVRAENSREDEARRRVAEERLRIARDLHDVVAHHIAVITVQAGVAQHLLEERSGPASEAMGVVRRSAASVLDELADILSVLREPGDPAPSRAPAPGLERLDALVESFAGAGLEVDWSLNGRPRELAPTVDLVAYRLIEEGLTNALKHGTGTAHLGVEYGADALVLRISNHTSALAVTRAGPAGGAGVGPRNGGHGLVGMKERAAAVGGTLTAAPAPADAFVVEARLPLRARPQS